MTNLKKVLTAKNFANLIFFAGIILLIFYPPAKQLMIRGLMKVGFFQPDTSAKLHTSILSGNIILQDTSGKSVVLSSLKGKVVFVNFWATWCPPCLAELPSVNELHEKFKANANVMILTVDTDNDFNKSIPFLKKHKYNLPLYRATTALPVNVLNNTIPTTVIISKNGEMVFHHEGVANYSNPGFVSYIQALAAE